MTKEQPPRYKATLVRWVRMFSLNEDDVNSALQSYYAEGWRVVAMATDNGIPHFTLQKEEWRGLDGT